MIDWGASELTPIEQLHSEAELLRLVEHWRTKATEWQNKYEMRDYELSLPCYKRNTRVI